MFAPLPATSLLLALLASVPATAQPTSEDWNTAGGRNLELTPDNARQAHAVRLGTGHPTHLLFNAPLLAGGVEVEDERLVAKAVNEERGMVTLLPLEVPPPDRLLWVTVRFADGAVPGSVTFRLVVGSTQGESQVRVYRRARSGESYQQEARQTLERAERCESDLARTRADAKRPEGLPGLVDAGLLGRGRGIPGRYIFQDITQRPGETLRVQEASSYHAENAGQVAVELEVWNT
ncbi:MAG TPA: DUF2381 family protein, partial [Myxococcus sp.]|nr:DUF2381 family protein [Myxococcus sp.]